TQVDLAVAAAEKALPAWRALDITERLTVLKSLEAVFKRREEEMAKIITLEMGKVWSESLFEAKNLTGRIELTALEGLKRVATEYPTGVSGETRYHSQGVLAVLGPYNFPAHLMNSHIIPALMTGNTIVAKPSEICPGVGWLYAECFREAGFPEGVFNLVQGRGDVGKALAAHPKVRGVLFTGSYPTGRALAEMLLDQPHKILALEMGGKNTAIVLDDADLYQALVEITQGAFQSAGQRCTATTLALIDKRVADKLVPCLIQVAKNLKPGDPMNPDTVMGPLASKIALDRYLSLLTQVRESSGCQVLLETEILPGGAFVTPSIYQVTQILDAEIFGPHLEIRIIDGLDEAIELTNQSAYGLSNAIFTQSEAKFERYYRETYSGVLNWNRSTNGLSGKAPFGGVGKSGNQRPAGIDAVRNATYPVMVQRQPYGYAEPLKGLLPIFEQQKASLELSLEDLVRKHEQEFSEQHYRYFDHVHVPRHVKLPASEAMLDRLYRDNLVPKEKKEAVIDLNASQGPYLVSIDEEPLVLFDAASQIASLGLGFSAGVFQKALDEGEFTQSLLSNAPGLSTKTYQDLLLSRAPGLKYATFTTSGAAANEKAFDLCRLNGPGGTRIIAFQGSFHGRSMMSLHATYNPEKRAGFELKGYEATFLPFGVLEGVREEILKSNVCAVIVEPVQCEGGDNFADLDFFRGLRRITRELGVPLIFDEVQTGFGLYGPFYYHTAFGLEDPPDCVTLSKKAQLGVVLSVWEDTRPEEPHLIQIQKGFLQAQAILHAPYQELEQETQELLRKLQESFPDLVLNPRNAGYAFAFDMPTPEIANKIVNQRFHRGFMVYIAGTKTLRFRTNIDTTSKELRFLFDALHAAIAGHKTPDFLQKSHHLLPIMSGVQIEKLDFDNWSLSVSEIERLEQAAYEPSRQDSMLFLRTWLEQSKSIGLIMRYQSKIVGFAIGGPLEHSDKDGCLQDVMRGQGCTFYSTDIVIDEAFRGKGLGYHLKEAQIKAAKALGYSYMTGRNRVGFTSGIQKINQMFGAYTVAVYDGQYGGPGQSLYYRIPLLRPLIPLSTLWRGAGGELGEIDWSNSIQAPLGGNSPEILKDIQKGIFTSAVGTKLTLSNWATPDMVRYTELLRHVMPKACKHLYFTSGRDEIVDKGLRCLKVTRPKAEIVIGLQGQYVGQTTAAARSLTDPDAFQKPFGWFNWPLVSSIEEIQAEIQKYSQENILGIVVELIGEKTGRVVSREFLEQLDKIRAQTQIPLIFVETASGLGRNGETLFMSDSLTVQPNMVWWYAGAQLGHIFVDSAHYVAKPLTLISTWDGDEISMRRNYRHILTALETLQNKTAAYFEQECQKLGCAGKGFWQALECDSMQEKLAKAGLMVQKGFGNRLILNPPLNSTREEIDAGLSILRRCLSDAQC
ncbi:MAG: aldehyde dehydrogenase family protein, partial [Myxococcaceae bacterium]